MHTSTEPPPRRIIVGCVGNVLRGDDGFGPAVAARLGRLPVGVEVLETGIGGIALLQELLVGCDGLIVVDAVDRGAAPGTVFAIAPDVADYDQVPDMHLATPERVLSMAKGLGCLPACVLMVGCQPFDAQSLGQGLSPEVEGALDVAVEQVREVVEDWLNEPSAGGPRSR
ncbi:MAG: hydrogenase maturation protease [Thermoleophilaceae bacterium]|nr:hydrogenase maturation protease [Thermoleophilaceae bacterium]